jgi:hypothetical protein
LRYEVDDLRYQGGHYAPSVTRRPVKYVCMDIFRPFPPSRRHQTSLGLPFQLLVKMIRLLEIRE